MTDKPEALKLEITNREAGGGHSHKAWLAADMAVGALLLLLGLIVGAGLGGYLAATHLTAELDRRDGVHGDVSRREFRELSERVDRIEERLDKSVNRQNEWFNWLRQRLDPGRGAIGSGAVGSPPPKE